MSVVILGVGNVLQQDDGVGIYAAAYLDANYRFGPDVRVVNGGVEGINLLNLFLENDRVVILDTIALDDDPGSIYNIPSCELGGYGLNSGGAHEVGVMQCLDMIELMGYPMPESNVIGIVPERMEMFVMGLSGTLYRRFETYVASALSYLRGCGVDAEPKDSPKSLAEIIEGFRYPSGVS